MAGYVQVGTGQIWLKMCSSSALAWKGYYKMTV